MQSKDKDSIVTLVAIIAIVVGFVGFNIFSSHVNPLWLFVIIAAMELLVLLPMAITKYNKVWEPDAGFFNAIKNIRYIGSFPLFILAAISFVVIVVLGVVMFSPTKSMAIISMQEQWFKFFVIPVIVASIIWGAWLFSCWATILKCAKEASTNVDLMKKALAILFFIPIGRAIALSNLISVCNSLILLGFDPYADEDTGDGFSDYDADEEV